MHMPHPNVPFRPLTKVGTKGQVLNLALEPSRDHVVVLAKLNVSLSGVPNQRVIVKIKAGTRVLWSEYILPDEPRLNQEFVGGLTSAEAGGPLKIMVGAAGEDVTIRINAMIDDTTKESDKP